jgi:hypothetical protein
MSDEVTCWHGCFLTRTTAAEKVGGGAGSFDG